MSRSCRFLLRAFALCVACLGKNRSLHLPVLRSNCLKKSLGKNPRHRTGVMKSTVWGGATQKKKKDIRCPPPLKRRESRPKVVLKAAAVGESCAWRIESARSATQVGSQGLRTHRYHPRERMRYLTLQEQHFLPSPFPFSLWPWLTIERHLLRRRELRAKTTFPGPTRRPRCSTLTPSWRSHQNFHRRSIHTPGSTQRRKIPEQLDTAVALDVFLA